MTMHYKGQALRKTVTGKPPTIPHLDTGLNSVTDKTEANNENLKQKPLIGNMS